MIINVIQSNMEKKKRSPRQGLKPRVIGLTALQLNHYTSWSRATRVVTDVLLWMRYVMKAPQLQPLPFHSTHSQSSLRSFSFFPRVSPVFCQ